MIATAATPPPGGATTTSAYLQMIVLPGCSQHVPLATRLLGHPVVDVTAEAPAHLVVRVLHHIFGEVAGALAPSDHGDHPGVPRYCLGCEGCTRPRDREVARGGTRRVGRECKSREGQGLEAGCTCAGVVREGTVGVEVFHGAINEFVH